MSDRRTTHTEGRRAYRSGAPRTANPYSIDTTRMHAWDEGWETARDYDAHEQAQAEHDAMQPPRCC